MSLSRRGRCGAGGLLLAAILAGGCSPSPPPDGAFEPGDDFEPLGASAPVDWLTLEPDPGQTFVQFVRSRPYRPDGQRHRLYFQPLGELTPGSGHAVRKLRELGEAFFGLEVVVLPARGLAGESIATRGDPVTGNPQLLTGDVLRILVRRVPADAFALLGFTETDLYPGDNWAFVYGQASPRHRVGVFSFARYDPRFYGAERPPDWRATALRRSCRALAHETSHLFGIRHCTRYKCVMNGTDSLAEGDPHGLEVCPVDLRKLHWSTGFDVLERYGRLQRFCEREGFSEAAWFRRRIDHLRRPS